jgi:hypothetical protein
LHDVHSRIHENPSIGSKAINENMHGKGDVNLSFFKKSGK